MPHLVLSRKLGEIIDLTAPGGLPVEITVVEIRGDKVRLGIKAPDSVIVDRREVTLLKSGQEIESPT